MLWLIIISAAVVVGAALSLWATYDSRCDIWTGQPKFKSVADVTGIWSRTELDHHLGSRDADDRYRASADQIRTIRRPAWKLWLDSDASDISCIVAALAAPFLYTTNFTLANILVVFAGANLILGYAWATYIVISSGEWSDHARPE